MELLQYTASLPWGSGQWNSCNTLPHCLGAVGNGTPATHCLTASGQQAVEFLQRTASLPGGRAVELVQYTASPPGGQWAVELLQRTAALPGGQWAVQLLQYSAPLPGGSGRWDSCRTPPVCLGAVGSGTPEMHGLTAWGQRAMDLLQYTASLPGGSGQWNSCNALPHCLGAVGSGSPAIHCRTAWGQWAVEFLQRTASLPGESAHHSTNLPRVAGNEAVALVRQPLAGVAICPRVEGGHAERVAAEFPNGVECWIRTLEVPCIAVGVAPRVLDRPSQQAHSKLQDADKITHNAQWYAWLQCIWEHTGTEVHGAYSTAQRYTREQRRTWAWGHRKSTWGCREGISAYMAVPLRRDCGAAVGRTMGAGCHEVWGGGGGCRACSGRRWPL